MKDTRLHTQVYNVTSLDFLTQLPSIDGEGVDYSESKLVHLFNKQDRTSFRIMYLWCCLEQSLTIPKYTDTSNRQ